MKGNKRCVYFSAETDGMINILSKVNGLPASTLLTKMIRNQYSNLIDRAMDEIHNNITENNYLIKSNPLLSYLLGTKSWSVLEMPLGSEKDPSKEKPITEIVGAVLKKYHIPYDPMILNWVMDESEAN